MSRKRTITLVSASPKVGTPSVSNWLSDRAKKQIGGDGTAVRQLSVRQSIAKGTVQTDFETMLTSDALILIFPLYIFCLPGLLIRYLQDFFGFWTIHRSLSRISCVFCVVNCGFPEPEINAEAVRVVKSFSEKINADFRFGLMFGGGGLLLGAADAPFMKKTLSAVDNAFLLMKNDIVTASSVPMRNIEAKTNFPRQLYFIGAGFGWRSMAKKNGLRKKDLLAKPYI